MSFGLRSGISSMTTSLAAESVEHAMTRTPPLQTRVLISLTVPMIGSDDDNRVRWPASVVPRI